MKANRIDFYTKVHKGLRASLFTMSQRAASADYADADALAGLAAELRMLLARLSRHAQHEAQFIHPLLAAKLGRREFDAEHETLEGEQAALSRLLGEAMAAAAEERGVRGLMFYRALNVFISRYLEHLDREEATMPLLWQCCTDNELAEVIGHFGASRTLEETVADLRWMLPALNVGEQRELLAGVVKPR